MNIASLLHGAAITFGDSPAISVGSDVTHTYAELRSRAVRLAGGLRDKAGLKKGARVEAIIDAIEALDGEGGLSVQYPSDYRDCVIRVDGVEAEVRCTGATLEVVFPRGRAPAELIEAFAAVRSAFALTKNRVLAGLL